VKSKYIQTLISQLISLILAISALKLAATIFDPADFGLYNLVKRFIAMISYPLLVGLGISSTFLVVIFDINFGTY
jgi:Na+/citrate or Na+/malate symporter